MEDQEAYVTKRDHKVVLECSESVKAIATALAAAYWTGVYLERDRLLFEIAETKGYEMAKNEWVKFIVQAESVLNELQDIE